MTKKTEMNEKLKEIQDFITNRIASTLNLYKSYARGSKKMFADDLKYMNSTIQQSEQHIEFLLSTVKTLQKECDSLKKKSVASKEVNPNVNE